MPSYVFNNQEWAVWGILNANVLDLTAQEVAKELAMELETAEKTLKALKEAGFVREQNGKFSPAN
jgi:DNA-binding transcriptional regulator YhcF (GntR family)